MVLERRCFSLAKVWQVHGRVCRSTGFEELEISHSRENILALANIKFPFDVGRGSLQDRSFVSTAVQRTEVVT